MAIVSLAKAISLGFEAVSFLRSQPKCMAVNKSRFWLDRNRNKDGYPLPSETFLRATSVPLLTELVIWSYGALSLPASAEFSVVEWRTDINLDPIPTQISSSASGVPVSAVRISLLFWAN